MLQNKANLKKKVYINYENNNLEKKLPQKMDQLLYICLK